MTRLFDELAKLQTPGEIEAFLRDLLTPAEFKIVACRWKIMEMLAKGKTQRAIASELGTSLCKITRGAKILKNPSSLITRVIGERGTGNGKRKSQ